MEQYFGEVVIDEAWFYSSDLSFVLVSLNSLNLYQNFKNTNIFNPLFNTQMQGIKKLKFKIIQISNSLLSV